MAERIREVAEIPQQFIKEGTLVRYWSFAYGMKADDSSLIDVRNLPRMVSLVSLTQTRCRVEWDEGRWMNIS